MMKRVLSTILLVGFALSLCGLIASARELPRSESIHTTYFEYYEDGSYCLVTIEERPILRTAIRAIKTGTKSKRFFNEDNILLFTVVVQGTFSYNGTTATATSASHGYSISNASWSFVSGSASCTGATATAICTFRSTPTNYKTISVSLTCSPTGVLS